MDLNDYLALDYPVELIRDSEQGGYFSRHPDLLGCTAEGSTAEEAIRNLDESRELWLEARLESGHPVPEPVGDEYAGRISLRTSPALHAFLARAAVRQGTSLNQLINVALSEWASGISVKDKVAEELRSLMVETLKLASETKAATKTEPKGQIRVRRGRAA